MILLKKHRAGQRGRVMGGEWHNMTSEAIMNAVDVMDYNPNVPVDPECRCHFTHDWVHQPVEWNGRLYSGAALRLFLNEQRSSMRSPALVAWCIACYAVKSSKTA